MQLLKTDSRKINIKPKKTLKVLTLRQWQYEWDYRDTGRLPQSYTPKVDIHRLISYKLLSQLFKGLGVFPAYLHRFKLLETPEYECGSPGTLKLSHSLPTNLSNPSGQNNTKQKATLA